MDIIIMKEQAIQFGRQQCLVGVVSHPAANQFEKTCCVFLTAGLTTKFGPFGLYAHIARRLAEQSVLSLRFDLDGIGDSGSCYSNLALDDRSHQEIDAALNLMQEKFDIEQFVLIGLCSGAEAAFRQAKTDQRVVGVVMFDPFAYATPSAKWRSLRHRVYRRLLRILGLYRPDQLEGKYSGMSLVNYRYMEKPESSTILKTLVARRAFVHFIYTSSVIEVFNHPKQLRQAFPDINLDNNNVVVDWLPQVSHTPVFNYQLNIMSNRVLARLLPFLVATAK